MTPEKLQRLKATGKLCPHFHLSLQSGSDTILEKMNRHYTTAVYAQKIAEIRDVFPLAGITTDVIVGFPEEGEKEFLETMTFTERIGFSRMHIFPYSKRQGTPAALFTGQVDPAVKKERAARLGEQEERLRYAFMDRMIGHTLEVLTEEKPDTTGRYCGYSGNYQRVALLSPDHEKPATGVSEAKAVAVLPNRIYAVQILRREGDVLVGVPVER